MGSFAACVAASSDNILVILKCSGEKFTVALTHSCLFYLYKFCNSGSVLWLVIFIIHIFMRFSGEYISWFQMGNVSFPECGHRYVFITKLYHQVEMIIYMWV